MQVALAWLLQRSPNLLLIPGTSSVAHLRENLAAADLALPADVVAELDAIAQGGAAGALSATTRRKKRPGAPGARLETSLNRRLEINEGLGSAT